MTDIADVITDIVTPITTDVIGTMVATADMAGNRVKATFPVFFLHCHV